MPRTKPPHLFMKQVLNNKNFASNNVIIACTNKSNNICTPSRYYDNFCGSPFPKKCLKVNDRLI